VAQSTADRKFAVALTIAAALLTATSSPWWWHRIFDAHHDDFVGGCETFTLYAQNQFDALGAKIWSEPEPTGDNYRGISPNEIVNVDGWVRTRNPYPTNPPPLDVDAWFHLANGAGWVDYAAVRSTPTNPDPANGSYAAVVSPAPLDTDCQGTWRP
jgi:hypothetical protein